MKTFELYEQYLEQDRGLQQARRRYDDKVQEAEQALADAKVKLDEVIHAELSSGTDKAKEKTAARKAIEQAEKDVAHAVEERSIAYKHFSGPGGSITSSQIVQAYLNEYVPAVKEEHLTDIKARMEQGQALIISALYDFYQLKREYSDIVPKVQSLNDFAVRSGEQSGSYYIPNPFENRAETGFDPYKLGDQLTRVADGYGLPDGVKYIGQAFETKEEK